ncbi:protease modulator HflC [Dissulfurirhabdus thermomarina]|uniref:Protein HflC n=1 Tax=Dissulfurirhabdus thermomarina TaxID=1765737 RepID=A0A6N9TS74_DISTH|nr:protease modulator HflC [Dissulfurirhabdus thermomarina]NDY42604.1 protease modulator HflC [Dissulfurirhabdus thermomarina]NMX22651.1 protease modulator HflC [Dissulfurirhabdus thermomarina]
MKQFSLGLLLLVLLLAVSVVGGAFYLVNEAEQVVITQFGKPVGRPITEPGLHVKLPFIQTANYFDKRFLAWDGEPNQVPTRDKRYIWVDTYARWRITDPLKFLQRLRDIRGAQSRLAGILNGETRNTIAKHDLIELVRSTNRTPAADDVHASGAQETFGQIRFGREKLSAEVLAAAAQRTSDLGIEILDFRFKRINYVEEVQREVYARMISERKRIAERYRSEGAGEAARIAGEKERELKRITSDAYRKAQEIKGKADAEAADVYAAAYKRDPDFYRFVKTLETYQSTVDKDTVLVLTTDGELFRYLKQVR